jgi:RNA recognition motif-containing protein
VSASVKKNHFTEKPRGFGYLNFKTAESAQQAKKEYNHTILLGREILISFKKDFDKIDQEANLYLKNIAAAVDGKQLEEEFSKSGSIFSCAVKYDIYNQHLGNYIPLLSVLTLARIWVLPILQEGRCLEGSERVRR